MGASKSKHAAYQSVQDAAEHAKTAPEPEKTDRWEVIDSDGCAKTANRIAFEAHKAEGRFENTMHLGRYAIYNQGKYVMVTPFPEHTIAMNKRLFSEGKPEFFYTADD